MNEKLTARLDKVHIMTDRKSAQFDSYELETIRHAVGNARNRITALERSLAIAQRALENLSSDSNSCMNVATQLNVANDKLKELNAIVVDKYIAKATAEITEATDEKNMGD